jgi:hypothetical protein
VSFFIGSTQPAATSGDIPQVVKTCCITLDDSVLWIAIFPIVISEH